MLESSGQVDSTASSSTTSTSTSSDMTPAAVAGGNACEETMEVSWIHLQFPFATRKIVVIVSEKLQRYCI